MEWANAELAKNPDGRYHEIYDQRNLAAAELYRLTGEQQWHDLFLATTVYTDPNAEPSVWQNHNHIHAAFVYGRTERPVDTAIQQNAINAMVRRADYEISNIENTAYKWNRNPWAPVGWGDSFGAPNTSVLLQTHALTGNDTYLDASLLASQFSAGANPENMVYTTGLGYQNPDMPLIVDTRALGQEPPPGITVYGPLDLQNPNGYGNDWRWAIDLFTSDTDPSPWEWPTAEAYFDSYYLVPVTEFTVNQSIGPTAYTWGYLAAADGVDAVTATAQGNAGNNTLTGTGADSVIVGTQPLDMTPGQGEVDVLIGGKSNDTFVIGDIGRSFYDDGDVTLPGLDDYALIEEFELAQGDRIQLHGTVDDYILGASPDTLPSGTAIFSQSSGPSELIAVVADRSPTDLMGAFVFT